MNSGSRERFSISRTNTRSRMRTFDGATTVWDLSADHWLIAACDLVGRNLTRDEWHQHVGTSRYRATCV